MGEESKSDTMNSGEIKSEERGLFSVLDRYKASITPTCELMNICNKVMEKYEEAEREENKKLSNSEPDADGFITVTYRGSTTVGSKDLEISDENDDTTPTTSFERTTPKNSRRNRKKLKKSKGSNELNDFYRFQTRESR